MPPENAETVKGLAGAGATKRFAERNGGPAECFGEALDLTWSRVGIGTYLGTADTATDALVENAVQSAVKGGINVVDTAANYRRGRAETAVGNALAGLLASGTASRDEIVLCTKAGYLPTPADEFLETYAGKDGITEDDLVGGNHCLHPAYIEDRIGRSCAALGVEAIDVFYLHNPEAQLAHVSQDVFDQRLLAAFEVLEAAARGGRIRCYGLATWRAFRASPGEKGYVSIAGAKALAKRAAGDGSDHFKCVQMPLSLTMPEAVNRPTQWIGDVSVPALAAARLLGLAVCASASIGQGKVPELSDNLVQWLGADFETNHQRLLQFTRSASGLTSALVGMKNPTHVSQNLIVHGMPPLPRTRFELMYRKAPV